MEIRSEVQIVLTNRMEELSVLAEKVQKLAEVWDLSESQAMNLNLVMEEAVSNIIMYAFDSRENQNITVLIRFEPALLSIRISDEGKPFDPTAQHEPDIALPAEERPIGGLGIFLISKIMDSVQYSRQGNMNVLTLNKNLI